MQMPGLALSLTVIFDSKRMLETGDEQYGSAGL